MRFALPSDAPSGNVRIHEQRLAEVACRGLGLCMAARPVRPPTRGNGRCDAVGARALALLELAAKDSGNLAVLGIDDGILQSWCGRRKGGNGKEKGNGGRAEDMRAPRPDESTGPARDAGGSATYSGGRHIAREKCL